MLQILVKKLQNLMLQRIVERDFQFNKFLEHSDSAEVKIAVGKLMEIFSRVNRDIVTEKLYNTPFDTADYAMNPVTPVVSNGKSQPKVSVIIPVYDVEQYLPACLDSLLIQTLKDIEIICVDDCSPDNSAQIMREYAARDSRIQNIHLDKNGGLSHARNTALKQASGEYIYFIDSDDMLAPEALEKLYSVAENNTADLIYFLPKVLLEVKSSSLASYYNDYPEELTGRVYSGRYLFARLFEKGKFYPTVCMKLFRRSLLEKRSMRFIEGYIHEDNYFSAKAAACAGRVLALNERWYIRRVRENSICTNPANTLKSVYGYIMQVATLLDEIKKGEYSREEAQILSCFCARIMHYTLAYKVNELTDAQKMMLPEKLQELPCMKSWDCIIWSSSLLMMEVPKSKKLAEDVKKQKDELKKHKDELKRLKQSLSYRLGRTLTLLPRKLRGGIRCYKQNGFIYTCQRVKYKIKKLLEKLS